MKPIVSIIMGSTSDLPVMEKAAAFLNDMQVPFEMNALSAHRTPEAVESFAKGAAERGIRVIIAAAGMAAHLAGVLAAATTLPVIGIPIKSSTLDGLDALLSTVQMPSGIPVATVAINGAANAALLCAQIIAVEDKELAAKLDAKGVRSRNAHDSRRNALSRFALLATGKPVYATNCIMGAGKPCSPISVVAWQEDSDTIIATGHVLRIVIEDDDDVTVINLVAG